MKYLYLLLFISYAPIYSLAQEHPQKTYPTFQDFLTDQNEKISNIENSFTYEQVVKIMGSSMIVKIPKTKKMKALSQLFKQPEYSNKYDKNPQLIVNVLWYFTTPKDQNGLISKNECTPVVLENNSVVGTGWTFFQKYRRTGKMR